MSLHDAAAPECFDCQLESDVALVIEGKPKDLGEMVVRRVLPNLRKRTLGPFIFFDHMGPAAFPPGAGISVRPHPHINLATVTYLYEGRIIHKDSLGSDQAIEAGAINWMTAGRGIVHSERTSAEDWGRDSRVHGLQLWLALPAEHEETEPAFSHHPKDSLPVLEVGGAQVRLLAGTAYGAESPVKVFSPLFYADVALPAGASVELPAEHVERGLYLIEGAVINGARRIDTPQMLIFKEGASVTIHAEADARFVILGGRPFPEKRTMWWNFVSTRPERIEQAKADWKAQRFAKVPGDEDEFIPLPS